MILHPTVSIFQQLKIYHITSMSVVSCG